jgi:hypothetical protein
MKKLIMTFIMCLASSQGLHAAVAPLGESLNEYEAITSFIGQPGFTTIGSGEWIVDIERITRKIDVLGTVK